MPTLPLPVPAFHAALWGRRTWVQVCEPRLPGGGGASQSLRRVSAWLVRSRRIGVAVCDVELVVCGWGRLVWLNVARIGNGMSLVGLGGALAI